MKNTFKYVDSIVVPVPKNKLAAYKKMAKLSAKVWRDHGAIDYMECLADDAEAGKVTSFPQSVKLKKGEIVVLSMITYKSRAHRDQVMKKVMADKRVEEMMGDDMPFDGMRMFWGGFKPFVMS